MQLCDLVAATDALAHEQDVGHSSATRHFTECSLELRTEGVLVELDDIGRGGDVVCVEEDVLRLLREGAIALGEDDYCRNC